MRCTKQKPAGAFALCLGEPVSGMHPASELVQAESDVCTDTLHIQYFSQKKKKTTAVNYGHVSLEKVKSEEVAKKFPTTVADTLWSSSLNPKNMTRWL